jgi:hypothetical protein
MVQIYVAGICNIGPEEIARRRNTGIAGLVIAIILFGVLFVSGVDPLWRVFVFFPAMLSASGFLQAYLGFCSGFARRGIFNLGTLGNVQQVPDDASRKKDRKKGNQITVWAFVIGVAVATACVLL